MKALLAQLIFLRKCLDVIALDK